MSAPLFLENATPEEMAQELARRKRTFVLCTALEGTRRLIAYSGESSDNLDMLEMTAKDIIQKVMAECPAEFNQPVKRGPAWVEEELAKP